MSSTLVTPAVTVGNADDVLTPDEVSAFVREQLDAYPVDGRSVCVLVPDGTRTCPLPLLLKAVHASLAGRATRAWSCSLSSSTSTWPCLTRMP